MSRFRRWPHVAATAALVAFAAMACAAEPSSRPASRPAVPDRRPAPDAPEEAEGEAPVKTKAGITLSRETTYITGPLNEDGTVNYVEYLNRKYGKGVTPENNAAVLMLEVVGPEIIAEAVRARAMRRMGIPDPPLRGCYLTTDDYVRSLPAGRAVPVNRLDAQFQRGLSGPWAAENLPDLAAWLKSNERALDLAVEASERTRFFIPLLSVADPPRIIDAMIPSLGSFREITRALRIRAMLRADEGNVQGAFKDLAAARRLARLVAQGPFLISHLVGIVMERMAVDGVKEVLGSSELTAAEARPLLGELAQLRPMPDIRDAVATERFLLLDVAMAIARNAPQKKLAAVYGYLGDREPKKHEPIDVDCDQLLRTFNELWNWHMKCLRIDDPADRERAMAPFHKYMSDLGDEMDDGPGSLALGLRLKLTKRGRTDLLAKYLLCFLMMPSLDRSVTLWERALANDRLTLAAAALAVHRAETGEFPKKLAELTPKLLEQVPADPFTGEPLIYRRTEDGYVLYSVGPDLEDDGGVENEDDREEGDLVVRVPPDVADEDE